MGSRQQLLQHVAATVMAMKRPGFPRRSAEDPRGKDHDPEQEATSYGTGHGKLRCQGDRSDE
jgi:hypothetical protein